VGGHQPIRANVRVIAATHQNLEERVRQGAFREDLFHRLNVIRLRLPPLRERREDVPALARFFLQKSARELGVEPKRITDGALDKLMSFDFPGNVRQLENVCHWLTVMAPAQVIEAKDLPPEILGTGGSPAISALVSAAEGVPTLSSLTGSAGAMAGAAAVSMPLASGPPVTLPALHGAVAAPAIVGYGSQWLQDLEREARSLLEAGAPEVWDTLTRKFEGQLIHTALSITRGRRIEAAQKLGIGRNTITRKIQELGLDD
jgi:two-component system nitrogen regulation response regulator GlnG